MASKQIKLISSIDQIPLIRKFAVTFFFMSVVPVVVIGFLLQMPIDKRILDSRTVLMIVFTTGLGVIAGFLSMRKSIVKIQEIASQASSALSRGRLTTAQENASEESEVTKLKRTFGEITSNLESNIKRLEASKRTMQYVLSKLAVGISSLNTLDTFLELIVEITTNALDAELGILMFFDHEKNELFVKTATGLSDAYRKVRLKLDEGFPGWVASNRKPLLVPLSLQVASPQRIPFKLPLLCAPMLFKDRLIGVLTVSGKMSGSYEEEDLIIVSNLASQTAIAVENDRLHLDAERTYIETISALALAVEARDPYSRGHSERVAHYSMKIAERLNLAPSFIEDIVVAGELHDVGKIGIGDDILKKPGPLSDEEWLIMRKHPVIGEGIIKPVSSLSKLCAVVRHHHEWVDGIGYPDGLKGDKIPLGAKILAVSDSFDAMTSDRTYRKAMSVEAAKEDLKKYIGIRYDKAVVDALISAV